MKRKLILTGAGDGWRLTFNYQGGGNRVELLLEGSALAVRTGLAVAALAIGGRVQKMFERGGIPSALFEEATMLAALQQGTAPLVAYEGKYLRVEPAGRVAGLTSVVYMEWSD